MDVTQKCRAFVLALAWSTVLAGLASCTSPASERASDQRHVEESAPLPRILILGDSISMGYHRFVVESLADEAVVIRPDENCAGTTKGVLKIDEWLEIDGGDFEIIHFNFGLHDLKRVKVAGGDTISNDPNDPHQADPAAYEENLRRIVDRLRATRAVLIFATTTPVPHGNVRPHRDPADVPRYNAVAKEIMDEHGITINDLYTFALPRLDEIQQPPTSISPNVGRRCWRRRSFAASVNRSKAAGETVGRGFKSPKSDPTPSASCPHGSRPSMGRQSRRRVSPRTAERYRPLRVQS